MALRIYNSLSRQLEEFVPLHDGNVLMYSCGPTVYDFFHIGNARTFLVSDVVQTLPEYKGYAVKFVQNLTDIDDKIINRAAESGIDASLLANNNAGAYFEDSDVSAFAPQTFIREPPSIFRRLSS